MLARDGSTWGLVLMNSHQDDWPWSGSSNYDSKTHEGSSCARVASAADGRADVSRRVREGASTHDPQRICLELVSAVGWVEGIGLVGAASPLPYIATHIIQPPRIGLLFVNGLHIVPGITPIPSPVSSSSCSDVHCDTGDWFSIPFLSLYVLKVKTYWAGEGICVQDVCRASRPCG